MSDTSRNQHYIPQFYLKGFLDPSLPKEQLHVIDQTERRSFLTNPRNVGSKRDFNRAEIPGLPSDDAEKRIFGLIDREAAKALKYIGDNRKLPPGTEMRNLIYFVAVLAAHNPYIRNVLINAETELHDQRLRSLVSSREMYESEMQRVRSSGPRVPYEVAKQFIEEERYTMKIEFPYGYHMGHELKTIQETIFPLFSRMQWSLIIAEEGTGSFVCSDRPVVLFEIINPPHQQHYSHTPTKPIVKDLELTMPLNLRMALHATFGDPSVIATASERDVAFINGRTIHAATRQIYCSHLDFKFLDNEEMKSGRDLISACESSPKP
jgi:hypothetical protein